MPGGGWEDLRLLVEVASKHPPLQRAREAELVLAAKAGDRRSLDLLVRHNLRLVFKEAWKYRWCGADFADLVQEGLRGFAHGIEKFDLSRGYRLTSYAMWWTNAYMHNLAEYGPVSVVKSPRGKDRKAKPRLADNSLDATRAKNDGDESEPLGRRLPCPRARPDEIEAANDTARKVSRRLSGMKMRPVERDILERRLMGDPPEGLAELGARYGVSRERIRQLEVRLKEKLRERLAPFADAA